MANPSRSCPSCYHHGLQVWYTVVRRRSCPNCGYLDQYRITGITASGATILNELVEHFLHDGADPAAVNQVLQHLLAKLPNSRKEVKP